MRRAVVLVLGLTLVLAGAGAPAAEPPGLTVFAASDLALAFRELVPRFEQARGARVTLVLGSTGNLARQVEHGAPADVFFAADRQFVDRLAASGAVIPETRALYAQGRLALVSRTGAARPLTDLRDLVDPRVRHVAIANPAHAPYGRAAEEALRRTGVWGAIRPKLVYGENVQHALQFVQSGAAEAGLVARSLMGAAELQWAAVDSGLHAPLDQAVAVVRRSARPELAVAFIRFVNSPEGRSVMKRYGFVLPGES
jgi:molybdate transport system substrate-binding protein